MKFPYARFGVFYRPVIPVVLSNNDKRFAYRVLVDTGADISIFHAEVAEPLGFTFKKKPTIDFGGITGSGRGYLIHFDIGIDGFILHSVPVILTDNIAPTNFGILGHEGLFDKIKLTFDYHQKEIEITPTVPSQVLKA